MENIVKSETVKPSSEPEIKHPETIQECHSWIDAFTAKVQELETQIVEKDKKHLYLYAEFENFKKRAQREQIEVTKFGWEPVAKELIQVIDNLERALAHMPPNTDKTLIEGLHMVLNQFKTTLKKQGVQYIETKEQSFDPNLHEAVAQEESDHPAGTIVREHVCGYTLHGRLLRPSRVVISGGKTKGI